MAEQFSAEVLHKRAALDRVRRRVAAIGLIAVTEHLVVGLIIFAHAMVDDPGKRDNAIGLLIMSGIVAVLTYVAVRIIVGGRLVSPWFLLALAPPVAGAVWVL